MGATLALVLGRTFVRRMRGQRVLWAMVNELLLSEARQRGYAVSRSVDERRAEKHAERRAKCAVGHQSIDVLGSGCAYISYVLEL